MPETTNGEIIWIGFMTWIIMMCLFSYMNDWEE